MSNHFSVNSALPESVRAAMPGSLSQTIFRTTLNAYLDSGVSELMSFVKAYRAVEDAQMGVAVSKDSPGVGDVHVDAPLGSRAKKPKIKDDPGTQDVDVPETDDLSLALPDNNDSSRMLSKADKVSFDVPLFIRLLEMAREEIKSDEPLHVLTEKIIAMSAKKPTLDMGDYNSIVSVLKGDVTDEARDEKGKWTSGGGDKAGFDSQMQQNLGVMSRTSKGTARTANRPQLTEAGAELAQRTHDNFQRGMDWVWQHKSAPMDSAEQARTMVETIGKTVSDGLLPKGQSMWRTWEDKHYSAPDAIQSDLDRFSTELSDRLKANADPVGTAAWVEHRFEDIHPFADGVGRTTMLLAAYVLARGGKDLPQYKSRGDHFNAINSHEPGAWEKYYRSLFSAKAEKADVEDEKDKDDPGTLDVSADPPGRADSEFTPTTQVITPRSGMEVNTIEGMPIAKRISGNSDIPLNHNGRLLARRLGNRLKVKGGLDALYTSVLPRAIETGDAICKADPEVARATPSPEFCPWHLGGCEGKDNKDVKGIIEHHVKHPDDPVPGKGADGKPGESFHQATARLLTALSEVLDDCEDHPNMKVGVVMHGRGMAIAQSWADEGCPKDFKLDDDDLFDSNDPDHADVLRFHNCKIKEIDLEDDAELKPGLYLILHSLTDDDGDEGNPDLEHASPDLEPGETEGRKGRYKQVEKGREAEEVIPTAVQYLPPLEVHQAAKKAYDAGAAVIGITGNLAESEGIGESAIRQIAKYFASSESTTDSEVTKNAWGGVLAAKWASRVIKKIERDNLEKNFNADQPRDKDGKWTSESGVYQAGKENPKEGYQFYSPNVEENTLSLGDAEERLNSPEHAQYKTACDAVDKQLKFDTNSMNAVGYWSDGAENSIFNVIHNDGDFDTVKYSAAVKGLIGQQKAVIPFSVKEHGPDSMYMLTMNGDTKAVADQLVKDGIQFSTLVPGKGVTNVVLFDPGTQIQKSVERLAVNHGIQVYQYHGIGEFVPPDPTSREAGAAAYRDIIGRYEAGHNRRYIAKRGAGVSDSGRISSSIEEVDKANSSNGVMVAFFLNPDIAKLLTVDVGESADQLHLTLAYIGKKDEVDLNKIPQLEEALQSLALTYAPITGTLGGPIRFNATKYSDGKDVAVASFTGKIRGFREELVKAIELIGLTPKNNFEYTPHVTLAFIDPKDDMPVQRVDSIDVTFNRMTLCIGGKRMQYLLRGTEVSKWDDDATDEAGPDDETSEDDAYQPEDENENVGKYELSADIIKLDKERHLVFGWFSICEIGGRPITDTQGDIISDITLEDAAYDFVLVARKGGEMHETNDDGSVRGVGRLIESVVFTKEKQQAMLKSLQDQGIHAVLDLDCVAWWGGMKIDSDETWAKVKTGHLRAWSLGGRGKRDKIA